MEAYNSIYNYELTGVIETRLDSTVEDSNLMLDGYTSIKNKHPLNVKCGGVGLYIKDSIPATNRPDIATLPECIVCDIQLNQKKYFFATIYRSLSQSTTELVNFMENFELMLSKMSAESPYCVIITGDFCVIITGQCHHQIIWDKLTIENLSIPPFKRKVWSYNKADIDSIRKSIHMYRWRETLDGIDCPDLNVINLNEILLVLKQRLSVILS